VPIDFEDVDQVLFGVVERDARLAALPPVEVFAAEPVG